MENDLDLTALLDDMASNRIDDESFAQAYSHLPLVRRGQLKSLIAWHMEGLGLSSGRGRKEYLDSPEGGLESIHKSAPCNMALFLLEPGFRSPSRLIAAIMPALCAAVGKVVVVCGVEDTASLIHGGEVFPVNDAILSALELAGVEDVFALEMGDVDSLWSVVCGQPGIRVMLLPEAGRMDRPDAFQSAGLKPDWTGHVASSAGVWCDASFDWDFDAIAFFHPDLKLELWGEGALKADCSDGMTASIRKGDKEAFLSDGYRCMLFTPSSMADEAVDNARLVAGPGREYFWMWPELTSRFFQWRAQGVFVPGLPEEEEMGDGETGTDDEVVESI